MAPSPYSLDGARRILTGPEDTWVGRLSALLGLGVLAAGPVGLAVGSGLLVNAWGWVDQKNEAAGLLAKLVKAGRDRLGGARTADRGDVLAATHTALVYGAFFAAIHDVLGPVYEQIAPTDEDKQRQTRLVSAQVPMPWAGSGFAANRDDAIAGLYLSLTEACVNFFSGFAVWDQNMPVEPLIDRVTRAALRRYEAEYKNLAAEVREFEIWAMLGEHEAAAESLIRLEEVMRSLGGRRAAGVREVNARINRALLTDPLVSAVDTGELVVPTVEQGYLSPSFRWTVMGSAAKPADDGWWKEHAPERHDLDDFLAAHFASPKSRELPLVVLGHPGSGKSMFTKVCAARLSASDAFAVARIPLRQVTEPRDPIYEQFASVLGTATNGRVSWTELSDASGDATRVLFVDGLDEFMQASGTAESDYLRRVVEFQRTERIAGHPAAVVVTSRTLVADLARIPDGCLVIRLEDFRPEQVETCRAIWAEANPDLDIPSTEAVLSYGELAGQPLLLLLLILYGVASGLPPMAEGSTPAEIYGGILRRFILRELNKPTSDPVVGSEDDRIRTEMWRLGIAAFGMFNRGQHYIDEQTLLDDLQALDNQPRQRQSGRLSAARRVLGKFFFVHAAEVDEGRDARSYEFLHKTFSEYLIAHFVTTELAELAESRNRPSSQNWDDDRLWALLSHRPLTSGGSAILPFVKQLHQGSTEILHHLLAGVDERWNPGRFEAYDPSVGGFVERYAAYTANLTLLLLHLSPEPIEVDGRWPRLVRVWQGYLPHGEVLGTISRRRGDNPVVSAGEPVSGQYMVDVEWLVGNSRAAEIYNIGLGILNNALNIDSEDWRIAAVGRAARAYHDPKVHWQNRRDVEMLAKENDNWLRGLSSGLPAANIATYPENFTEEAVASVIGGGLFRQGFPTNSWPMTILLAQYPDMSDTVGVANAIDTIHVDDPNFAALLAGAIVWGDRWPPHTMILRRAPEPLRAAAEALRPMIDAMAGIVDERRQVLMVAGHLVVVLQRLLEDQPR